jgi:hypothetical protein
VLNAKLTASQRTSIRLLGTPATGQRRHHLPERRHKAFLLGHEQSRSCPSGSFDRSLEGIAVGTLLAEHIDAAVAADDVDAPAFSVEETTSSSGTDCAPDAGIATNARHSASSEYGKPRIMASSRKAPM